MRAPAAPLRLVLPVALLGSAGCLQPAARLYATSDIAPSLSWDDVDRLEHMGPTIIDGGVNFSVYSERAERIELLLFDDPEADLPTWQVPLVNNGGPVWNVFVEGLGIGQHYGFVAWGPNWVYDPEWFPGSTAGFQADVDRWGNRFNPNKLLFDPWGKALHRDHDWSRGSTATGPKRHELTWGAAAKSVVVVSDYTWSAHEDEWRRRRASGDHPGHNWNDLVVYEVHAKGLTMDPAGGSEFPGTWRGIGDMGPYLSDLGMTAVEFLPIHEKPLDGGYWGYNNLSFFAPEHAFSAHYQATGRVDEVLDEWKEMVDRLHQSGVEVIVDVVYNHTGEGGLWRERMWYETYGEAAAVNFDPKEVAGLYSYRGLDNAAWYALTEDNQYYWNNTGVGNQTRPNHAPGERLILDSLRFMVEELHVDGFRFDLAGILGEPDLDYNGVADPRETVLQAIIDDPVLQQYNTRIIAEPWTAAGTGPGIGGFPTSSDDPAIAWGEWNAHFRDWWRSFLNEDGFVLNRTEGVDGGAVMTGSAPVFGWNGRQPYHSVNFITAHDGFTLYDLFTYTEKQNGCGLLNPKCCSEPLSVWCDTTSGENHNRSRNWGDEGMKRQMMRNSFVAMYISHGTPMILGGDEWIRTQYGNNNAYTIWSDNEWNWHRWGEWMSTYAWMRHRMHDFVRDLGRLRRERSYALSPLGWGTGMPFYWKTADNVDMGAGDWSTKRHTMIHYVAEGDFADKPELLVLINMERGPVTFTLPGGRTWGRLVDTQSYYDSPGSIDESGGYFDDFPTEDPYASANITLDAPLVLTEPTYTVVGSSIVILEQQR